MPTGNAQAGGGNTADEAIVTEGLTRRFGSVATLDRMSFAVPPGIYGGCRWVTLGLPEESRLEDPRHSAVDRRRVGRMRSRFLSCP
jgi:hypothetical protein